jgi:hypothetical protein
VMVAGTSTASSSCRAGWGSHRADSNGPAAAAGEAAEEKFDQRVAVEQHKTRPRGRNMRHQRMQYIVLAVA